MTTKRRNNPTMPRVMVIGDTILDINHYGTPLKMSVETPTLVAKARKHHISTGGAALLVRNLATLGVPTTFVTLFGNDDFSFLASKSLRNSNIILQSIQEKGRTTTVKERYWVNGYKLLQWDHLDNRSISSNTLNDLQQLLSPLFSENDIVLVSDYRHGLMTKGFSAWLVQTCHALGIPLYVDSQVAQSQSNHTQYRGADLFCLNETEAHAIDARFSSETVPDSLSRLRKKLKAKHIVLKLGNKGCAALLGKQVVRKDPHQVRVIDTSGAGDAFLAGLATHIKISARTLGRANYWASRAVQVAGANPPPTRLVRHFFRI